jgi:hypothetical protein
MNKEPKYKIGQEVWIIHSSKAISRKILAIRCAEDKYFYYGFDGGKAGYEGVMISDREDELYPTKDELISSL